MAEAKRWIAMYTKHIKQKRKVYHDGFLDVQINGKKVILYDEAENMLESKTLKADEVVSSGETLTFQAYLVDICDPKEGSNASSDPKVEPRDQGFGRKPFAVMRPNFKKSSLHCVFKKRELHKYEALSPDAVKPSTKGNVHLGSTDKESKNCPLINSPCDGMSREDSRQENDKLGKDVLPPRPLRDVTQILSILQRRNVTETCSDSNPQMSVSLTEVPTDSDASKSHIMEPISSRVAGASRDSLPQNLMVRETSSAKTTVCTVPPSFDLGI